MWTVGQQQIDNFFDYNQELRKLTGDLDNIQSKITLAKFLHHNIGFTFNLFSGMELFEFQEIVIKAILNRDVSMIIGGRGVGKSFLIAALCILYPIFNPNSAMCLISTNFRGSRRILEMAQKIVNNKKAGLLRACFPKDIQRSPDMYRWRLENGSEVFALPLASGGGEGIRGVRCNFLCIDEGLLITKETQEVILRPFLTVKQNVTEQNKIREIEDDLIRSNILKEEDRIVFPRNKFAIFSSASYDFEYLYEMYKGNIEQIMFPKKQNEEERPPTYFVTRLGYEAVPVGKLFDMTQILAAKNNGGENTDYFKREYRAIFSSSNDGYFNAKIMHDNTVKNGDFPTAQIIGQKDSKYILSLDPSYSANKTSDWFGMQLWLLNESERKITLVHNYGLAGKDISDHFAYLTYLLTYFNVVFIIIDASGDEFLKGYNESSIAKDKNIKLSFIDAQFDTDDASEYNSEIRKAKNQYSVLNKRIIYAQKFNSINNSIRRMNEHLKHQLEGRKVWFASALAANRDEFEKRIGVTIPVNFKDNKDKVLDNLDFIQLQDQLIVECKAQCSLIEIKSTASGHLQFDLPLSIKHLTSQDRPRRDLYTCALLGTWGARLYFDLIFCSEEKKENNYIPILI